MFKKLFVLLMIGCSIAKLESSQAPIIQQRLSTPPNQIATPPVAPPNQKLLYAQAAEARKAERAQELEERLAAIEQEALLQERFRIARARTTSVRPFDLR